MRTWQLIAPSAVLAALTLSGCGSAPTAQEALADASVAGPSALAGVDAVDAALDLGRIDAEVASGWVPVSFQRLEFALPASVTGGTAVTNEEPDETGYRTYDWSGDAIAETTIPLPDGTAAGMPTRVIVRANPDITWDGRIPAATDTTFTAVLADGTLVGGTRIESPTAIFDPRGNALVDRPVSDIRIYFQSDTGIYYEVHLITSPGEAGDQVLRQFLAGLSFT